MLNNYHDSKHQARWQKPWGFILRWMALVLAMVFLSGCDRNNSDYLWRDYHMRLGNVFAISEQIAQQQSPAPVFLKPPAYGQRQQVLQTPKVSLWQFLKLQQCELNALVAKRNGPLGKVMSASQTLVYAHEFLPLARQCLEHNELPADLVQAINQARDLYKQQRLTLLHNALFAHEWSQAFHARGSWPLDQIFPINGITQLQWWLQLKSTMAQHPEGPWALTSSTMEDNLKHLGQGQIPGHWIKEITLASWQLKRANAHLSQAKTLCANAPSTSSKSQIMWNVFQSQFGQKIQPWISNLHRFADAFEQQLRELSEDHGPMSAFHRQLFDDPQGPWQVFQASWRQHVQLWQRHLKACKRMPSRH